MMDFVEILEARIKSDPNLSDSGLARMAGLDNSTIRQMIKHRRSPRIDTAFKICRALGDTVESFMAQSRDPAMAELMYLLEQLTPEERGFLLASARGLHAQRHAARRLSGEARVEPQ